MTQPATSEPASTDADAEAAGFVMPDLDPPAAVFFDADGVLQRPSADWGPELSRQLDPADHDAFLTELFEAEYATQDGTVTLHDAVRPVAKRWGLAAGDDADALDHFVTPWHEIEVDPECLALVESVRRGGTPAYLTTNQNTFRGDHMKAALPYGDLFDGHFYSCDVGYAKPDPQYFRAVCDATGLNPEQVLFIDDRAENIEGARRVGLRAELFHDWSGAAALRALLLRHGVRLA